ncbi:MAG: Hpt domain-containing protein [Desulfosudaceae bacterium]
MNRLIKNLTETYGVDADEASEIIEVFIKTSRSDLARIEAAVTSGDAEAAANASHSIKGAAGNLGLTEIYEAARNIEQDFRQNRLTEASQKLALLNSQLAEIASHKSDPA